MNVIALQESEPRPMLETISLRTGPTTNHFLKKMGNRACLAFPSSFGYKGKVGFSDPQGLEAAFAKARLARDSFLAGFAPSSLPSTLVSTPADMIPDHVRIAVSVFQRLTADHHISFTSLLVLSCFKDGPNSYPNMKSELNVSRSAINSRFYELVHSGYLVTNTTCMPRLHEITPKGISLLEEVRRGLSECSHWYKGIHTLPFTWFHKNLPRGGFSLLSILLLLLEGVHSATDISVHTYTDRICALDKLKRLAKQGLAHKHTPSIHGTPYYVITALAVQALGTLYQRCSIPSKYV